MKNKILILIFILVIIFLIMAGCEDSTSNDNPVPGRVVLVAKSAEYDSVETGIDAEYVLATTPKNGVFLQWYKVDDNDLAAYRIYRSTVDTSTALMQIAEIKSSQGKIDTFYTDNSAEVGIRYYYRISAVDEGDQEGPRSRAADYELYEMCTLFAPNSTTQFDGTFQWQWPTIQPPSFVFRLLRERSFGIYKVVRVEEFPNDFYPNPVWSLSDLKLEPLQAGKYRWRIDVIGTDVNQGSESAWSDFTVGQD